MSIPVPPDARLLAPSLVSVASSASRGEYVMRHHRYLYRCVYAITQSVIIICQSAEMCLINHQSSVRSARHTLQNSSRLSTLILGSAQSKNSILYSMIDLCPFALSPSNTQLHILFIQASQRSPVSSGYSPPSSSPPSSSSSSCDTEVCACHFPLLYEIG